MEEVAFEADGGMGVNDFDRWDGDGAGGSLSRREGVQEPCFWSGCSESTGQEHRRGEGPPGKGLGQVGWAPAEEAQGYQPKKPTQVGPACGASWRGRRGEACAAVAW